MRTIVIAVMAASLVWVGIGQADQGRMREALEDLREARGLLEAAPNDKGGHKTKAIEHINRAITEVEQGIAFAEGE